MNLKCSESTQGVGKHFIPFFSGINLEQAQEEAEGETGTKRRICLFTEEPLSRGFSADDLRKTAKATPQRCAAGTAAEGGPNK